MNRLRYFALGLVLLAGCVATGLQIVVQSQEARSLAESLHQARLESQRLSGERSRLLLERGALASYQHIDRIATEELAMRFPDQMRLVVMRRSSARTEPQP